jgi:hypothetical protein
MELFQTNLENEPIIYSDKKSDILQSSIHLYKSTILLLYPATVRVTVTSGYVSVSRVIQIEQHTDRALGHLDLMASMRLGGPWPATPTITALEVWMHAGSSAGKSCHPS